MRYAIAAIAVVAIIVVVVCFRSGRSEEPGGSSPPSHRPLLRQFGDLRPGDFEAHPVWVQCHVVDYDEPWYEDTDEETFRPWDGPLPANPAEAMLLVTATLALADGTGMPGFITPQNPADSGGKPDLSLMQPQVFLPDGSSFGFWFGIATPPRDEIASFYAAVGKSRQEVFPIAFEADDGLAAGITSGAIAGFCSRGEGGTIKVVR